MPQVWRVFSHWLRLRRRLWRWRRAATKKPLGAEAPLRSQLFNVEQMEMHGRALARAHRIHTRPGPERLLDRLGENEGLLDDVCALLTRMVQDDMRITPAGEWLLDNYYLVEEQVLTARRHLPKGYSRQLPSLSQGPSSGLPRVYDLSQEAIAHGDGRIDAETLSRFFAAYQSITPLKLGELWAIPIMLRLALIDNLRRMAVRVMRDVAGMPLEKSILGNGLGGTSRVAAQFTSAMPSSLKASRASAVNSQTGTPWRGDPAVSRP